MKKNIFFMDYFKIKCYIVYCIHIEGRRFMLETLEMKAYAKVNLGLDVLRKREDGYHEVRMIMQTVGLYDVLRFQVLDEDAIVITSDMEDLPVQEDNLIYKAVQLMKDVYHIKKGMKIELSKNIPVAAGMAGGSTDCAVALIAAAKLFELDLSKETLMELGVKLGADVPYCILRGTAISEGIGEVLTPLPAIPDCYFLIAKPQIAVSTKYVYEHFDAKKDVQHPNIDGMIHAIEHSDLGGITNYMENVLEAVTVLEYPVIDTIKQSMKENGAKNAIMSGSGPTVFGIFDDLTKAEQAREEIIRHDYTKQVYIVKPFNETM